MIFVGKCRNATSHNVTMSRDNATGTSNTELMLKSGTVCRKK